MGKSTWIDIRAGLDDLVLQEHHRPYEVFSSITNPDTQTPQMILMVGAGHKTVAIQKLRSGIARTADCGGDIQLSIDPETIGWPSPVLIADCELHRAVLFKTVVAGRIPGNIASRSLTWRRRIPQGLSVEPGDISNLVYTQLMLPFSTLICLFADDFQGLEGVARLLAAWLANLINCPSDLPRDTHPRIIILRRVTDNINIDELALMRQFLSILIKEVERRVGPVVERRQRLIDTSMLFSYFGDIRILTIPEPHSTPQQWEDLRRKILAESERVRVKRLKAKFAFSATHFKQLFSFACDHFCSDVLAPFNFIRATRRANPVPINMTLHLSELISRVNNERPGTFALRLHTFAVPAIASALVLDAFPPEMHMFNPIDVFNELCKPSTAGVRAIIADGRGVGGASLFIDKLKELKSALNLDTPILDHFDLSVGSYYGGFILLGLDVKGWSLEECDSQSQKVAKVVFQKSRCLLPSRYRSTRIDEALRNAFGESTAASGSCAVVFSNYGSSLSEEITHEVKVSEIARATLSDSRFFKLYKSFYSSRAREHSSPYSSGALAPLPPVYTSA
ncbi:hypothetical protein V501_09785 [Pseudogymnoascus sp. VKM F-4519 (FW-2642)]|nr:hypothetical protein V501_09785 [Pseudogymnoascus sp. VKM F-4519 (FW-2642)]